MVQDFRNINDYLHASNLGVTKHLDNFLIYDYQEINPQAQVSIQAFRHHYFEVSLEINTGCSFQIDKFKFPLQEKRLSIIAPNRLQSNHTHTELVNNSKGFTIFFERNFLSQHLHENSFYKDFPFLNPGISPSFQLNEKQLKEFINIFKTIKYEQDEYGNASQLIILNLTKVIFEKAKSFGIPCLPKSKTSMLTEDFSYLCCLNFLRWHSVQQYANELCVTPKHLTEVVKENTGLTALETIHAYKIEYAKGMLSQTDLTVKQIALELGFENHKYFNVFFKKNTGITPNQFRQN
ncbi:MAG: helix-turn-helix domain-containing protein [Chitinophagaceae bacterium]|jgi:AraC-like DNA-binding protein|nr:helix-turn-helix domain-containing protein [Chitinophagaceae bacterium]